MMSLTEVSVSSVTKKLYMSKLKAYIGMFASLVFSQLLAMVFSLGSNGGSSGGSEWLNVQVSRYSGAVIFIFAIIWVFTMAILLTSKANRDDHYAFVTNRLTSHLSNGYILITASVIGGVTVTLSSFLLKLGFYYYFQGNHIILAPHPLQDMAIGISSATLYLLLIATIGYFFGLLAQLNKLFIIIIPAILIGGSILGVRHSGKSYVLVPIIHFFTEETSILLFALKVAFSVGILFAGSILISTKMEVGH